MEAIQSSLNQSWFGPFGPRGLIVYIDADTRESLWLMETRKLGREKLKTSLMFTVSHKSDCRRS